MQSNFTETFMKYVFIVCASLSILSIILIFYFIFEGGVPLYLKKELVTLFLTRYGVQLLPNLHLVSYQ